MFTGLLFTTEDMKKDKVQVPQKIEMPSSYCTVLGFISKNEEYKLENNFTKFESNSNKENHV